MQKKGVKVFFSVILAVVLLCGTVAVAQTYKNGGKNPYFKSPSVKTTEPEETRQAAASVQQNETATAPQAAQSVQVVSVGDNLIHDGIYQQAAKRANNKGYDFAFCYSRIAPIIQQADLATINQETIISKSSSPAGYPMFNSPVEVGEQIVKAGFDVVNMANNHMLDKGAKGLSEAIDFWSSQKGVVKTGAYRNKAELEQVEYIEKNGIKIGLVGVTQYLNGLSLPKDSELELILTSDERTIEQKIKKAKTQCDAVMVNVHWGTEYQTEPTQEQKKLAQKMADWGADVIIGHHPHVLQPVTWLERTDGGKTLCVYSLGNFISQQNTAARVVGGMLHYTLTKENGRVTVQDAYLEPVVTHYVKGAHDVQIYPLSDYSDALAKKQSTRLKQPDFSLKYIHDFVHKVIPEEFLKA